MFMFNNFVDWSVLATFSTFVTSVFILVEFTKELPYIKNIKTKYYSALIAFVLLVVINLHANTFSYWDIVLYVLSACSISLTSNGLSDFNHKVLKNVKDDKNKTNSNINGGE